MVDPSLHVTTILCALKTWYLDRSSKFTSKSKYKAVPALFIWKCQNGLSDLSGTRFAKDYGKMYITVNTLRILHMRTGNFMLWRVHRIKEAKLLVPSPFRPLYCHRKPTRLEYKGIHQALNTLTHTKSRRRIPLSSEYSIYIQSPSVV